MITSGSIVEYMSSLDHSSCLGLVGAVIDLANKNECPEDHIVVKQLSTILQDLSSPSSFLDVDSNKLLELMNRLDEMNVDGLHSTTSNLHLDMDLTGETADLFCIAVGYATQDDFWINPRITNTPRSYQSIIDPIIYACNIRLRSVVTSGVTELRKVKYRYRSGTGGLQNRSIDKDVNDVINTVRSEINNVKKIMPSLNRYDAEICPIDIAYWNALNFCEILEQISDYFYALAIILPTTLVDSNVIMMRMDTWTKTRNLARASLATTIQRAYRNHLLKRKRRELLWLIGTQVPTTLIGTFPLGSRVLQLTV